MNECTCNAGFEDVGGDCSACAVATYKEDAQSNNACTACQAFETTAGTSTVKEEDCLCIAGYTPTASGCEPCQIGFFKESEGNGLCVECGYGSTTAAAGSVSAAACLCQPGYVRRGSACEPCNAGTFKSDLSDAECTPCPAGTYSATVGASSSAFCTPCPVGRVGEEVGLSAADMCTECPVASYSGTFNGTRVCLACPLFSSSPSGASNVSDCVCDAGFYPVDDMCVPCKAGSYKSDSGNFACSLCPPGTFEARRGSTATWSSSG